MAELVIKLEGKLMQPKMELQEKKLIKMRNNAANSMHPHIMVPNVVLVTIIDEVLDCRKSAKPIDTVEEVAVDSGQ
tara:strand:- start:463 stop:690 length:228 start_codon:yes stop_codon:yes gene_type:complete